MYNVEDLEEKWRIYKSKKRIPWYAFIVVELIVAIYIVNIIAVNNAIKQYLKDSNITMSFQVHTMTDEKIKIVPNNDVNATPTNSKVVPKIEIDDPELLESVEKEHERKYLKIEVTDKYQTDKTQSKVEVEVENEENIGRSEKSQNAIENKILEVKKSFLKTKSYDDALTIAKIYYDNGQYLEAEKWALVANNINSSIEEGWFLFVKSKVKMGDLDEAEEVLGVYIEKTGSKTAQKLLIDIQNGNL